MRLLLDAGAETERRDFNGDRPLLWAAGAGQAEAVAAGLKPGGVVMAEAHEGAWFDGIGGVSVYMAPSGKPLSAKYRGLAFARETGWWECPTQPSAKFSGKQASAGTASTVFSGLFAASRPTDCSRG